MKKQFLASIGSLFIAATLVACGGGGSSTAGGTTTPVASSNLSGRYVDAPTQGLTYKASPSGLSGTTDQTGSFSYVAGDTVSFSLTLGGVSVPMGEITIPADSVGVISVMNLPNSGQLAAAIQSLATSTGSGASQLLNLSNISSNTAAVAQASSIASYVNGGNAGVQPTAISSSPSAVSAEAAEAAALAYISYLDNVTPSASMSSLMSGKTYFSKGIFTNSGNKYGNANISVFNANGTYSALCINTVIWNGTTNQTNSCVGQGTPGIRTGTWKAGNVNTFSFTDGSSGYTNTITLPIIDPYKGLYKNTNNIPGSSTGNGVGKYQNIQTSFQISSLAGKSFKVNGSMMCSSGYQIFAFGTISGAALPYSINCPSGDTLIAGYTAPVNGSASNDSVFPGIVDFTVTDSKSYYPAYIGLTLDSSSSSGSIAMAKEGSSSSSCTVGGDKGASSCGFVKTLSFTLQ